VRHRYLALIILINPRRKKGEEIEGRKGGVGQLDTAAFLLNSPAHARREEEKGWEKKGGKSPGFAAIHTFPVHTNPAIFGGRVRGKEEGKKESAKKKGRRSTASRDHVYSFFHLSLSRKSTKRRREGEKGKEKEGGKKSVVVQTGSIRPRGASICRICTPRVVTGGRKGKVRKKKSEKGKKEREGEESANRGPQMQRCPILALLARTSRRSRPRGKDQEKRRRKRKDPRKGEKKRQRKRSPRFRMPMAL